MLRHCWQNIYVLMRIKGWMRNMQAQNFGRKTSMKRPLRTTWLRLEDNASSARQCTGMVGFLEMEMKRWAPFCCNRPIYANSRSHKQLFFHIVRLKYCTHFSHTPCGYIPLHLIVFDFITRGSFGYEFIKLIISHFLRSVDSLSLSSPNILLCTLFLNTINLSTLKGSAKSIAY
jgi:hypothetical protein